MNVATSIGFLVLVSQGQALAALVVGYLLSVPYNMVALVGVWRSAARYDGPPHLAQAARIATLIGMILLSLT